MASSFAVDEGTLQGIETTKNTEDHVVVTFANNEPETPLESNFDSNLPTTLENFHDSGFLETEHFHANTDEINGHDNPTCLDDIDVNVDFILADFIKGGGSWEFVASKIDAPKTTAIPTDSFDRYHDILNPRASAAYRAILDFQNHAQPRPSDLDEPTKHTWLQEWVRTYDRHESIACRLERAHNSVVAYKETEDAALSTVLPRVRARDSGYG